jgi:hypothetical protein
MTGTGWLITFLVLVVVLLVITIVRLRSSIQGHIKYHDKWKKRHHDATSHVMEANGDLERFLKKHFPLATAATARDGMCVIHAAIEALTVFGRNQVANKQEIDTLREQIKQRAYAAESMQKEISLERQNGNRAWAQAAEARREYQEFARLVDEYLVLLKKPAKGLNSMKSLTARRKLRDELRQQIEQRLLSKHSEPQTAMGQAGAGIQCGKALQTSVERVNETLKDVYGDGRVPGIGRA